MNLQLFAQERTEQATPRRREEARRRGQVYKSRELVGAITLLAAYGALELVGPYIGGQVLTFSRTLLSEGALQDWSQEGVHLLLSRTFLLVGTVTAPLLLTAAVAGTAGNLLQVGFLFSLEPLVPKWERINPISGMQRVFSRRSLMEMFKAVFKVTVIGYIAYRTVADELGSFPGLLGLEINQMVVFLSGLISRLFLWVGVAMLVLALADYAYERWEYEQSLRMTRQEVKDEFKQTEGNPEVRQRIRQKQREMARRRMMQDVPKADVVVTNPTHYAVALAYQQEAMSAPKVLAKGRGLVALRIREVAEEHGVPVVENPPLARELHSSAEIGQEIPVALYQAVAEVLAFVYNLKEKGYAGAARRDR